MSRKLIFTIKLKKIRTFPSFLLPIVRCHPYGDEDDGHHPSLKA